MGAGDRVMPEPEKTDKAVEEKTTLKRRRDTGRLLGRGKRRVIPLPAGLPCGLSRS
jgi:hypothetical protein